MDTAAAQGSGTLAGEDQVILGTNAADHYNATVGSTVSIKGQRLQVVGLLTEDVEVVNNAVIMSLEQAQEIFARPDIVSAVLLTVRDVDRIGDLARAIESSNPELAASTSDELARTADDLLGPQRAFFASIRGTIIAVGVVVVTVVMIMAVSERRREIGTLKALGASRRHILSLILSESVILSLTGGILATLFAWFLTRNDPRPVDAVLAIQTVLIAVLVGMLAALWPALSASRVDPIESLRHE